MIRLCLRWDASIPPWLPFDFFYCFEHPQTVYGWNSYQEVRSPPESWMLPPLSSMHSGPSSGPVGLLPDLNAGSFWAILLGWLWVDLERSLLFNLCKRLQNGNWDDLSPVPVPSRLPDQQELAPTHQFSVYRLVMVKLRGFCGFHNFYCQSRHSSINLAHVVPHRSWTMLHLGTVNKARACQSIRC